MSHAILGAAACAIVLSIATRVAAQPAAAPNGCEVAIVTAPDDVRPVIVEWVGAETRCAVSLSVRVLPVDGGLYVMAVDDGGRVYERVVPDGITAAVLIASWVADDGGVQPTAAPTPAPTLAPAPAAEVAPAPAAAPDPAPAPARVTGPTPAPTPPGLYEVEPGTFPAARRGGARHEIAVGAEIGDGGSRGVRVGVDVMRFHGIRLGLAAGAFQDARDLGGLTAVASEGSFVVQGAIDRRYHRLGLRVALGLGVAVGQKSIDMSVAPYHRTITGLSPAAEAEVSGSLWVTRSWAARAGVIAAARMHDAPQDATSVWDGLGLVRGYVGVARAW